MKLLSLLMWSLAGAGAVNAERLQLATECRPLDTPERLPSAGELLDSAALAIWIAEAPVADTSELRVGVAFPRPSGAPHVWLIDAGVTPEAQARLAGLVQAGLRPDGARPGTTLRIHLRVTAPIGVRVERSILCAPVPLDSSGSAPPAIRVSDNLGYGPRQSWKAVIRQRISADGSVLEARLQPGSGKPEMDRLALLPVYSRRWRPATLNGHPVAVWLIDGRVELAR